MFDATGKSNSEVFSELLQMLKRGEALTVKDLVAVVATRSVVDTYASKDALIRVFEKRKINIRRKKKWDL